jgi:hypothetical protein
VCHASTVTNALRRFFGEIQGTFECAEVVSTVGTVFTNAICKMGGFLADIAATSKLGSSVKTAEGHTEKNALHGKFYMLAADLKDAPLMDAISSTVPTRSTLSPNETT